MKKWLLSIILGCSGCSSTLLPFKPSAATPIYEVDDGRMLQPQRSVSELLNLRLRLCGARPELREALIEDQPVLARESGNPVDEKRLNALLLASCEPARTPGVLNQLLAQLTAEGIWPEEYAALFDLLIAGQKAYATVEKVYQELEASYAALQEEHEQTILGLGEIETQIEEQSHRPMAQ